ncbi:HAD-IIA family hydrolase [Terracoccus sp. 273MFTsu3.1]|uniref:HAD-IIA family hydrolase n=1 Tax=Terracoccus sp. 273MFTsu3.1 TaxID=1172188 RepID=UPI000361C0D9|nr:HAD-IIA family hydrolase [Terracoccus sp. 273MFTsu3.1]
MDTETSTQPLIAGYDGVVCDLDGVVYRGPDAVPGAPKALQDIVARGVRVVYATNNASRVPTEVATQIADLGAPATASDVVSSAQAGAARLAADLPPGAAVLALGGEGVVEALRDAGLVPVAAARHQPGPGADEVAAVLQGFGKELRVRDFERAARLLSSGLPWVATNDDATLPLPWGQSPGNGAYIELLVAVVGRRPDVVGKPHPPLYRLALDRLGTVAARTLAVGDRIGTDIVGAEATGLDSAWVLTGVDRPSDLVASESSPTYVVVSLADLLTPYAAPVADAGGWRCGAARVELDADHLVVEHGSADPVEVVRAGLAALLASRDEGAPSEHLRRAAATLDRLFDDSPTPTR